MRGNKIAANQDLHLRCVWKKLSSIRVLVFKSIDNPYHLINSMDILNSLIRIRKVI